MQAAFLTAIEFGAQQHPDRIAVQSLDSQYSYQHLWNEVSRLRTCLKSHSVQRLALAMTNCPAWIALDLAAACEGIPMVAVPHFFSRAQIRHLISDAKIGHIIRSADPEANNNEVTTELQGDVIECMGTKIEITPLCVEQSTDRSGYLKISYTSGTTGDPKGVLISNEAIDRTVDSLIQTMRASTEKQHLSVLPYSLLLENIVGIYAVLASGGCCRVPNLESLGMSGSSRVDWNKFSAVLQEVQPNSMIVVPALLQGLMHCAVHYKLDLSSLNFIAVGGAPVSSNLLRQAQDMGLPVYQGYGMTECASVICLNTPEDNRIGSVGKPLPHVDIRIDEHGEIVVRGGGFIAYMNTPTRDEVDEWCTGDLGYFDAQGYLYVTARRSSSYSSAYGRNIAPEWVESELDSETVIAQSAVFGEGRKHNISVLVPVNAQVEDSHIAACVVAANRRLPDYAQIAAWTRADSVFEISNSQCSASGVLQREQIYSAYRVTLDQLFEESEL